MSENEEYEFEVVPLSEIEEGDVILGVDDSLVEVKTVFDEHIPETMYEIEADDGTVMEVSGNHLFYGVTGLDREMHPSRLATGKKLGKNIPANVMKTLVEVSETEPVEQPIYFFTSLLEAQRGSDLEHAVIRVAESLGHVAEYNEYLQDIGSVKETYLHATIRAYNSQEFANQLLSLFNFKNFRKAHPVLVGRVMTTEEMLEHDDISIPEIGM